MLLLVQPGKTGFFADGIFRTEPAFCRAIGAARAPSASQFRRKGAAARGSLPYFYQVRN
jgi:hypothetical protein